MPPPRLSRPGTIALTLALSLTSAGACDNSESAQPGGLAAPVQCSGSGSCPAGTRQLSASEYKARSNSQFYFTSNSCETLCEAIQPCLAPNVPRVTATAYTCAPLKGFASYERDDAVDLDFGSTPAVAPKSVAKLAVSGDVTLLQSGDFDGDGDDDLVATDVKWPDVALFTSHGDGTFTPEVRIGAIPGTYRRAISVGRFDADTTDDLAVLSLADDHTAVLLMFRGQTGGGLAAPTSQPITLADTTLYISAIGDLRAGDFDGDGKTDLVMTYATSNSACCDFPEHVDVYWGAGDGTFAAVPSAVPLGNVCGGPPCIYSGGGGAGSVTLAVGDFTGDGATDIFLNAEQHLRFALARGSKSRVFAAPVDLPTNAWGLSPALAGDLDGDGDVDVAGGGQQTAVALNQAGGTFPEWLLSSAVGCDSAASLLADLDGDGRAELVLACRSPSMLKLAESGGGATLLALPGYPLAGSPTALTAGRLGPGGMRAVAVAMGSSIEVVKR